MKEGWRRGEGGVKELEGEGIRKGRRVEMGDMKGFWGVDLGEDIIERKWRVEGFEGFQDFGGTLWTQAWET